MRTFLLRAVPQYRDVEYNLLRRLGDDLPGAIRVVDDALDEPGPSFPDTPLRSARRIRASLAGLQPKLSVLLQADKVTVPVSGLGGSWIAKFPARLESLPENEFALLRWAAASGLDVPKHLLVDVRKIEGLPEEFVQSGLALLVQRFDRGAELNDSGSRIRIHQEDFAQVLALPPELKYATEGMPDDINYTTLGKIIYSLCGPDDFWEYFCRLLFVAFSGNADAHPKNWALFYPDRRRPRLSPAYDLVCTRAYAGIDQQLALPLSDELDMEALTVEHFLRLAELAGAERGEAKRRLEEFAASVRSSWKTIRADGVPDLVRNAIDGQLDKLKI